MATIIFVLIALFVVVGLLIAAVLFLHHRKHDLAYWQRRAAPAQKKAVQWLEVVGPLLDQAGLTWWLAAGALLGWVRHNQHFIPWDDDIDLNILVDSETDEVRLSHFLKLCEEQGYHNTPAPLYGYDFATPEEPLHKIDLFIVHTAMNDATRVEYTFSKARAKWPKDHHAKANIFPLQRALFENTSVWIPCHPRVVVATTYGPTWEKGIVTHCHTCPWWDSAMLKLAKPL